jgi:hypothetical protein
MLDDDLAPSGFVFGTEDTGYLTITRPTHSGNDGSYGDITPANEDGTMFGRDYMGAKSVAFDIGVLTDSKNALAVMGLEEQANLDFLDTIEGVWKDQKWRNDPGAYAVLRCCEANRTSRAYGRPRRYAEVAGNFTKVGYTPITCTFDLRDDRWYSDVEQTISVSLIPSPDGGITAPLVTPLTTSLATAASSEMVVGGSRSTWPVIDIHGPVAQPIIHIDDLTFALSLTVPDGDVVTIDPRPWRRGVTRASDQAGMAGSITAPTPPLSECTVGVGAHDVTYRGTDPTGTSYVQVRWRDARSRP